ncbi:hypothetical protein IL306_007544 [Fusarium sp. DS 682]|nr:hypothetical protein IL306_007544 [Fusarium sp. DS 682]
MLHKVLSSLALHELFNPVIVYIKKVLRRTQRFKGKGAPSVYHRSFWRSSSDGGQNARFDEGQRAIDRSIRQLLDQEQNFVNSIGNETIKITETILVDPSGTLPFFWETNQDTYYAAEDVDATQTRISVNRRDPVEWRMDPWPLVNMETFDPLRGYPVAISQVGQRGIVCPGRRHGLALEPFNRHSCTWSIKPRHPGNNRYSFRFISGFARQANNNYYMITRPSAGVPGRIMSLFHRVHREDGSHLFYVKPQGIAATL